VPDAARSFVLVGRFLLELCLLAALAWAGASVDAPLLVRILLAVALPACAAVLWGMFVAPKRRFQVSEPTRLLVELALFAAGALALVLAEHLIVGLALGAVALLWAWLARL
jgi:hypothetical protein